MKKIKEFFKDRNNLKNIILVVQLILIVFLLIKCNNLQKQIDKYEAEKNNMVTQKVQLPDIENK